MRIIASLSLLLLSACAKPISPLLPPSALRQCSPEPAPPNANSQRAVALYLLELREAGADCRDRLAALNAALGNNRHGLEK